MPAFGIEMREFHWWRTVFYLIPAVTLYTIALGTVSLVSTLIDRTGNFAHRCARAWATTRASIAAWPRCTPSKFPTVSACRWRCGDRAPCVTTIGARKRIGF